MRYVKSMAIMMTSLMVFSALADLTPVGAESDRTTSSRVDTETANDDINGADVLTSGVPNPASLLVSAGTDVQDWFRINCARGQVLNTSVYLVDWNPADPGQYNLNIAILGPDEKDSLNYVTSWFSFLQSRWETGSTLCAFDAAYFVVVIVNATNDNPPVIATDPTNYIIDITVQNPPTLSGGQSDQKVLSAETSGWFQWYKIGTSKNQVFNARLQNPNGGNIDMDMFGLWQRGYDIADSTFQGYQPFFMNQTRQSATNGNTEQMQGLTGELDVFVRLWLREGTGLGQYTFDVQNSMIPSDGDNVPTDARLITQTTSTLTHGHQSVDKFDWFEFDIDAGFDVDITFSLVTVKSSYWNMTIWDDQLNYVEGWFNTQDGNPWRAPQTWGASDPGNAISSAGVNKMGWTPPGPGTYYVMIMSIAGDPVNAMGGPPLADQQYRLFISLPNYGPSNSSQISDATIDEDTMFSGLDLIDYFQDDEGDPLSFSASDDNTNVKTELSGSNVSVTPVADWFGTANITVEATDGSANIGANTIKQTFKLTVTAVNDDPFVKQAPANVVLLEGQKDWAMSPATLPEVFDDIDSQLTYTFSGESKIQVKMMQPDYRVYFSAPDLWFGDENITFTAKDAGTNVATVSLNVRVDHRNHAPTLSFGKETYTVKMEEDDAGNFDLNVADMFEDIDISYADDELTYRLKDPLPLHLNVSIMEDYTLSIVAEANWSGDAEFKISCEDKAGGYNETIIQITVKPVNDPPEIKGFTPIDPEMTIDEGDTEIFTVTTVVDIDNDTKYDIRYKWYVDNVIQTDENVKNHQFSFVTYHQDDDGFAEGEYHIKCVITDGSETDEVEWTVTVVDVNLPPVGVSIVNPDASLKYTEGKPLTFEADMNAVDPDGDPLYYTWVERESNVTLGEDSAITIDWKVKEIKKALKPGKHTIDLTVTDGRGGEVTKSVTITIKAKKNTDTPGFEGLVLLGALAVVFVALRRRRTGK